MLPTSLSWFNVEFVEKILKISENNETIEMKSLAMEPVTTTGDNYFSDMIRAIVEYSFDESNGRKITEKKSLIIKAAPTLEGARKKLISETGVYDIEIKMMETTLVRMNELLNEEGYRLNARAIYTESGDRPMLVFEDLGSLGYRMADRQTNLDLDHCILVMRGLAKFHASSVALYEKDPNVTEYRHGVFHTNVPKHIKSFFINGLKAFANEILDWPELGSSRRSFSEKVFQLADVFYEKAYECYKPKADGFNVLNHGDCFASNMLFRYNDENKVIDHIFVDFQMCCWTTPLMDILRFMNSNITEDVDLYHHDLLLQEYLDNLTKTMSRIGCKTKPPKMSVFKKIQPEYEILSVIMSCVGLPIMLANSSKDKSLDELLQQTGGFETAVYKIPEYRRRMLRRLHAWNANGVFDL